MDIKDLVLSSLEELENLGDEFEDETSNSNETLDEDASKESERIRENIKDTIKDKVEQFNKDIQSESKEEKVDSVTKSHKVEEVEKEEKVEKKEESNLDKTLEKDSNNDRQNLTSQESETIEELVKEIRKNREFLIGLRERTLVLFEGLQSENVKNLDVKVDLTLNFMQFLVATIDDKLENS